MGAEKIEGTIFGPQADEKEVVLGEGSRQVGAKRHAADYIETGYLAVGGAADGGVLIGGGKPPEGAPWLTAENLLCTADPASGREECEHYIAVISEAEGVSKGFGQQLQIRRWCRARATASELWELEETVYACTARRPADLVSLRRVRDFEAEQLRRAAEAAREDGEVDL